MGHCYVNKRSSDKQLVALIIQLFAIESLQKKTNDMIKREPVKP